MVRVFKHYIPKPVFALGFVEILILAISIGLGLTVRFNQLGFEPGNYGVYWTQILIFIVVFYVSMLAVGLYQTETCRDLRVTLIRLGISAILSLVMMAVVAFILPDVQIWSSIFAYGLVFAIIGILSSRVIFVQVADLEAFKRKVLILGAGKRASRLRDMEESEVGPAFRVITYLKMNEHEKDVPNASLFEGIGPLAEYAKSLNIDEIVVASEERRGTLPVSELLACKMAGIKVTDATTFIEQHSGAVDLESMSPSWLIFSDGFVGSTRLDHLWKRCFDVLTSTLLLVMSLPVLILAAIAVKTTSPGPIFYRQERVGQGGTTFSVMKFRSMRNDAEKNGPQWAQKNDARVTPVGKFLRSTRIDEIPQIFNVLRGDMSFVGPRPERPVFVEELAREVPYFTERHRVKPGITGWAQINYPYGASVEDARQKLQYDLYYIKNYSIFLDFIVLIQTLRVVLWPDGVR